MTSLYPWLSPVYQKITQAFEEALGHHALLIRADNGLGAEQLCTLLAQRLMCLTPKGAAPCGTCHACHLMQASSHPDFHLIASIENKDIGVDQIRAMNEQATQHAQQNGNKVIYIEQAHRLTEAAANAILKTLEEPRPNTYFILQCDMQKALLPTIYSRCQVWNILPPETAVAVQWLQSQTSAETSEISTALRVNYGRPLLALAMLEQNLLEQRREFLRQFWLFYRRCSPLALLPFFNKEIVLQQLDWLSAFLSDSLKNKLNIREDWICQDIERGVVQFSQGLSAQALLKATQIVGKVRSDLAANSTLNLELILLDGLTRLITEVFEG
ncbi:DNA polymerase III subunit delta' [Aggregatibacter kilianii]|uniref:DNA polymerase III subunit delta' n=1 Tax=Aggregatibacter kilianii TaxID=2025884 RepID=UPI000D65B2BD|nr:DNA polymerase III subunit delta' [Aggregatibacter kilianii]